MPPTPAPAITPDQRAAALFGFAALMRQLNPEFELQRPTLTACGTALTVANWVIAIDQSSPPGWAFGKHGNCNAQARCVGCTHICEAEAPAFDLSVRAGGRSALWIEARNILGDHPVISVRSFVPGRPGQSDVWFPIQCPATGRLVLIATNRSREARLRADGRLMVSGIVPSADYAVFAATVFCRSWQSQIKQHLGHGTIIALPAAAVSEGGLS